MDLAENGFHSMMCRSSPHEAMNLNCGLQSNEYTALGWPAARHRPAPALTINTAPACVHLCTVAQRCEALAGGEASNGVRRSSGVATPHGEVAMPNAPRCWHPSGGAESGRVLVSFRFAATALGLRLRNWEAGEDRRCLLDLMPVAWFQLLPSVS